MRIKRTMGDVAASGGGDGGGVASRLRDAMLYLAARPVAVSDRGGRRRQNVGQRRGVGQPIGITMTPIRRPLDAPPAPAPAAFPRSAEGADPAAGYAPHRHDPDPLRDPMTLMPPATDAATPAAGPELAVDVEAAEAPAGAAGAAVKGRRYCLISPCRDEAEFMLRTLESVHAQTERPTLWVIVDDGSTDGTPVVLRHWEKKHDYIRVVTRSDRGTRKLGGGVIDAFYAGYETIDPAGFDYVCKLDLDLELPAGYFATLMDKMEADPRLATVSGKPYMDLGGRLVSEKCGDENSVGMTKFYRREAFEDVGGFEREVMWDGIDCHVARMRGWRAESLDEPGLRFTHLRPMGTSDKGWWTGRERHGFGQHYMGTHPLYMVASAFYRLSRPPVGLGGVAMLWGYLKRWASGAPRFEKDGFRPFLRRYQWRSLLKGKKAATDATDAETLAGWRARFGDDADGRGDAGGGS